METATNSFIRQLTREHRVVVLGGMAVIAHGLSRSTYDADIWLEPLASSHHWAEIILRACKEVPGTTIHRLPGWLEVSESGEVEQAVEETGMIRIRGLDCPLDIFRRPNEFNEVQFDEVIRQASRQGDGTFLPSPLDLIQSKMNTSRDKDLGDIQYLESVVRADYKARLPLVNLAEAQDMLAQYSEWQVLQAALKNPSPEVQELARTHLREFAAAGDPFSIAILEGRALP
jgi:hypothetical protein